MLLLRYLSVNIEQGEAQEEEKSGRWKGSPPTKNGNMLS
jgi:hypothetical protein